MLAALTTWLKGMQGASALVLGLVLGGMMAVDMGGPINKAAYASAAIAHLVPREESYGTRRGELVGRPGIVVQGTATADLPAEARVADARGRPVYVAVVPAPSCGPMPEGTRVVLTGRKGIAFVAEPAAAADAAAPPVPEAPPKSGKAHR